MPRAANTLAPPLHPAIHVYVMGFERRVGLRGVTGVLDARGQKQ